jgi:hypothetical protein
MERLGSVLLAILAGSGFSLCAEPAILPVQAAAPSPEQTLLATRMLQAVNVRADAKALFDKMLSPAISDLERDYPGFRIAEWADRYSNKQAEAQYQKMLADLAQIDVQQLREMATSINTDRGKAVLSALAEGDLSGQVALSEVIDQGNTPAMRRQTRLELLKGACAEIACPSKAQREIEQGENDK